MKHLLQENLVPENASKQRKNEDDDRQSASNHQKYEIIDSEI